MRLLAVLSMLPFVIIVARELWGVAMLRGWREALMPIALLAAVVLFVLGATVLIIGPPPLDLR